MKNTHLRAWTALALLLLVPSAFAQTARVIPRTIEFQFDGINFAPDGQLYFCGSWRGSELFRSTTDGKVEVIAQGFEGPTDTVMDSKGNIYVSNYNSTYISIIQTDGEVKRFAETPLGPAGMAIDANDNIFVTIYGTPAGEGNSVLRITPAGDVSTYIQGPDLHASVGLAIDDKGALYISSGRDGRIFRSTRAGQYELFSCLPLLRGGGAGNHLDWAGGYLYAASNIGAIFRINPEGAIQFIPVEGGDDNNLTGAASALLENCNGIAAAPDGTTLFLGCSSNSSPALVRVDNAGPPATAKTAWAALQNRQHALAEHIFEELAGKEPVAPGVYLGLGTLRYRQGRYQAAAGLFTRAAQGSQFRAHALYNAGCSFALAGDINSAFAALVDAIDAGFADASTLKSDTDLESLHSDPRWSEILARF